MAETDYSLSEIAAGDVAFAAAVSCFPVTSDALLGMSYVEDILGGAPFNVEPGGTVSDTQSSVSPSTLLLRFTGGNRSD